MSNSVSFDAKDRSVYGDGFFIKSCGRQYKEPYFHIFQYSSSDDIFYFGASREIGHDGILDDTKTWDVKILWKEDESLIGNMKSPISVSADSIKNNIIKGLQVMEALFIGTADRVVISAN